MIVYEPYNFGERVKTVLYERHLNSNILAKMLGLSYGSIYRMLRMKDVDTERMREVSIVLEHDFVAEFGASSQTLKKASAVADAEKLKAVQEEVTVLKERIAEQEKTIDRMALEAKYLKELVEAYKKK